MSRIDGATRIYAIIGDPIAQARSPVIYNARLAEAGRNAVLVPWHAKPPEFEAAIGGLMRTSNVDGIIVTYPYKQNALRFADSIGIRSQQVGATNAMRREADGRWLADMFDGIGCVRAIAASGRQIAGARVWLIGAGGAGSAIAFALADAGVAGLYVTDLLPERSRSVALAVSSAYSACRVAAEPAPLDRIDILINATPVGLADGDVMPMKADRIPAGMTVVDIVPRKSDTPLLALAKSCGARTVAGGDMVEGQVGAVLDFFAHAG